MFSAEKLLEKLDRIVRPYLRQIILNAYRAGAPIEDLTQALQKITGDEFKENLSQMPEYLEDITVLFKDDIIAKFFQVNNPSPEELVQLKTILRQEIIDRVKELNVLVQEDLIPKNKVGISDDQIRIKLIEERRKIFPRQATDELMLSESSMLSLQLNSPGVLFNETLMLANVSGSNARDVHNFGCYSALSDRAFEESMEIFKTNFLEGDEGQFEELKSHFPKSFEYFKSLFNVEWACQLERPKENIALLSQCTGNWFLQNLENALQNPVIRPLIKPFDSYANEYQINPKINQFLEAFSVGEAIY